MATISVITKERVGKEMGNETSVPGVEVCTRPNAGGETKAQDDAAQKLVTITKTSPGYPAAGESPPPTCINETKQNTDVKVNLLTSVTEEFVSNTSHATTANKAIESNEKVNYEVPDDANKTADTAEKKQEHISEVEEIKKEGSTKAAETDKASEKTVSAVATSMSLAAAAVTREVEETPQCSGLMQDSHEQVVDIKTTNVEENYVSHVASISLPVQEPASKAINKNVEEQFAQNTSKDNVNDNDTTDKILTTNPIPGEQMKEAGTTTALPQSPTEITISKEAEQPTCSKVSVNKAAEKPTCSKASAKQESGDKVKIGKKPNKKELTAASAVVQPADDTAAVTKLIDNLSISNKPSQKVSTKAKAATKASTPSTSTTTNEQPFLYLNPITLEANFFLKTVAENIANFQVVDVALVEALESVMITISALLRTAKDRCINETDRIKLVPRAEMQYIRRSLVCVKCHKFVGNNAADAAAHLANQHEIAEENGKKKSKKQRKRERALKQHDEQSEESIVMEAMRQNQCLPDAASNESSSTSGKAQANITAPEQAAAMLKKSTSDAKLVKKPNKQPKPAAATKAEKSTEKVPNTKAEAKPVQPVVENPTNGVVKKPRTRPETKPKGKPGKQQLPKKARALINNNMQQFFFEHVQMANILKCIPAYDQIERDLMTLLRKVFPTETIKLYKFGSRISGVGSRESDLDIYVDIGNTFGNFENRPSAQTLKNITKVRDMLNTDKTLWKHMLAIINTRVPILTVMNDSTRIKCDIGFSNSLGYCNTKLMEYFFDLQPITRCLVVFLKKWLDRAKLHGTFSSYSIILMVIYYLQVNKLLPSVQKLQISLTKKLFVGPWLANFQEKTLQELEIDEVNMNTQSVKILLRNFFDFYSKFPYDKCAICPYFGKLHLMNDEIEFIMPKRYVDYVHGIGRDYRLEIANKAIVVQDPIQMNHNVTKNVSANVLLLFKDYLEHSVKLFSEINN